MSWTDHFFENKIYSKYFLFDSNDLSANSSWNKQRTLYETLSYPDHLKLSNVEKSNMFWFCNWNFKVFKDFLTTMTLEKKFYEKKFSVCFFNFYLWWEQTNCLIKLKRNEQTFFEPTHLNVTLFYFIANIFTCLKLFSEQTKPCL